VHSFWRRAFSFFPGPAIAILFLQTYAPFRLMLNLKKNSWKLISFNWLLTSSNYCICFRVSYYVYATTSTTVLTSILVCCYVTDLHCTYVLINLCMYVCMYNDDNDEEVGSLLNRTPIVFETNRFSSKRVANRTSLDLKLSYCYAIRPFYGAQWWHRRLI